MPAPTANPSMKAAPPGLAPLYVDLDGSLLATDSLHESLAALLSRFPWKMVNLPGWLAGGKAHFKSRLAATVPLDPATLPYREAVVERVRAERARGRRIVLATGATAATAGAIAEHLGLFDGVIASDDTTNRTGVAKLAAIEQDAGGPFEYLGNSTVDLPIWQRAERILVVDLPSSVRGAVDAMAKPVEEVVPRRSLGIATWVRAIRVHQWAKNLLLFVPVFTAHLIGESAALVATARAFFAFSFLASAIYLLNDLVDLNNDRVHPTKRHRPLASGALPIGAAVLLIPLLIAGSAALALTLPRTFQLLLLGYLALTTGYSFRFKQVIALDAVLLASLYTIRIAAGAAAVLVTVSPWLFVFSIFLFLSLALVKRTSELYLMQQRGVTKAKGRGYRAGDLETVVALGSAAGYAAVVVVALYVNGSPEAKTLYQSPGTLYAICPVLLYWLTRIWILARRGEVLDDPVIFAIKDRVSYLVVLLIAAITLVAA